MLVQQTIEHSLNELFDVAYLQVANESHMHSVPPNSETHFKVTLVTNDFDGVRKVARQQRVYKALSKQLAEGVHALALHTYTKSEWQEINAAPSSPNCMGGSK